MALSTLATMTLVTGRLCRMRAEQVPSEREAVKADKDVVAQRL